MLSRPLNKELAQAKGLRSYGFQRVSDVTNRETVMLQRRVFDHGEVWLRNTEVTPASPAFPAVLRTPGARNDGSR